MIAAGDGGVPPGDGAPATASWNVARTPSLNLNTGRRPSPQPPTAAAHTLTTGLLQFKKSVVMIPTWSRAGKSPTGDPAKDYKLAGKGSKLRNFKRGDQVELADSGHRAKPNDTKKWLKVEGQSGGGFIKSTKLLEGFSAEASFDSKTRGGEDDGSPVWGAIKGAGDISNAIDDPLVETGRRQDLDVEKWKKDNPTKSEDDPGAPSGASTGLTRAEGGMWLAAGIFGMATSIKDLADNDKDAWERVDAAISLANSTAGVIGSIAQIAGTHLEDDSPAQANAEGFGAWGLGYQEMFTGLSAGVKTIKSVVDLVKMLVDEDKHSSAEWVKATGALLTAGLETAKGVLRSIRQVSETLGGAVTEQFAKVLPGLDIAIAAVKSIVQGYYLLLSAIAWHRMSTLKKDLGQSDPEKFKEARKAYKHDSARVAQLEAMVQEKNAKIDKAKKKLKAVEDKAIVDPKAQRELHEKIQKLERKRDAYEQSKTLALTQSNDTETAQVAAGGPDRVAIEEYDLSVSLESDNKRRVARQAIHIVSNLIAIGASIASLVSGPGAPAAIALKAAAIGVDTSLPFFRWVKQQGRNAASRAEAKGAPLVANLVFNADKSDTAKLADRKKQAVTMLKMIARLNPLIVRVSAGDALAEPLLRAQGDRIKLYLKASGVNTNELFALNGQPAKQVLLLVKAMAQRELD